MTLKQWMKQEGVSALALAKRIKIARWTLDRYLSTDRVPAPRVVLAVYRATKGAVQPNDFYRLPKVAP